jgi:cation-transporting ATPase E
VLEEQAVQQNAPLPSGQGTNPVEGHEAEASTPPAGDEVENGSVPGKETRGIRRLFGGLTQRVQSVFRRNGDQDDEQEADEELAAPETMLAFAYAPDLVPLYDAEGQPQLPGELIPLCTLTYAERVRPEAMETLHTFAQTGVDIKVFTAGEPERTATMLRDAGWRGGSASALRTITGPEIAGLQAGPLARAATEHTIFGRITPQQAGQVVAALRGAGQAVAVVGDSTGDLPPLRQANLAISRQSSTQAALSVADIVLLEDSPAVLSTVLGKGQRIVNGLLDVLKLNLSQVFTLAFLLVSIRLLAAGYPYRSGQGTVVAIVTVALPSIGLSLGASAGVLATASLGRMLARIVVPASLTMGATAFLIYAYFLESTGSIAYAQLTLMYTLVGCGLLLVVFIKPPRLAWWSGSPQSGAWWPLILAVVLAAAVVLVARIPLAQQLLQLDVLRQPTDYGTIGLAVLAWAATLRLILGLIPLERRFSAAARRRLARA